VGYVSVPSTYIPPSAPPSVPRSHLFEPEFPAGPHPFPPVLARSLPSTPRVPPIRSPAPLLSTPLSPLPRSPRPLPSIRSPPPRPLPSVRFRVPLRRSAFPSVRSRVPLRPLQRSPMSALEFSCVRPMFPYVRSAFRSNIPIRPPYVPIRPPMFPSVRSRVPLEPAFFIFF
jgi:hypothetical protein